MYKKRFVGFVLIFTVCILNVGQAYASSYNVSLLDDKIIEIESPQYGSNMRIMVEKDSDVYYYSLKNANEHIPVQLGAGTYIVKILQNVEGNKYKVIEKSNLNINNDNLDVFLSSSQPVYWNEVKSVIELGNEIVKDSSSELGKVEAIYNYVVENIKYDNYKMSVIPDDYVPDLGKILQDKKGICYDYSALFAGLLRSQGIYTKLVKGYKNDIEEYHAWNEVLLDDKWVIIDTTYDAALFRGNRNLSMIKSSSEYNKIREY
ncbi:transglutaminase-like domain-containing protein [Paratissierella segnis]|uniref:Transglutaminase domain-containing protein n=1 Tax=Paratissierella segnis TaxID=2763679 RepID=A0A926IKU4_9FIRM|nr:transglutaminase-like domain-containing protein [Paratissierella segnis]MBC8588028.1 transglutaminase domain-containing protein [Paratissierella segnis]